MIIRKVLENEMQTVRELFRDYAKELNVDLCFQDFNRELEELPGVYQEPEGCILVCEDEQELKGVVALKKLEEGICEMKRLYLKPNFRTNGNGRKLAMAIIKEAKNKSYQIMKLDTIQRLTPAVKLYKSMGFKETKAYNYNPDATVLYFQKEL